MSSFDAPTKRILAPAQLAAFQASPTHAALTEYIMALADAVVGVKLSAPCAASPVRLSRSDGRDLIGGVHRASMRL
jgi:hypothetical protein